MKVGFHLFGTPFVDFFKGKWAKMEYLTNYWVVLPHFCCNDIIYWKFIQKWHKSGQWVMRYERMVVGNRVYAAGKQTFLPQLATFKLKCYQQLPLGTELDCCQLGRPYSIHISKVPLFQAFIDPLWYVSTNFNDAEFCPGRTIHTIMTQIRSVGGEKWEIGGEK